MQLDSGRGVGVALDGVLVPWWHDFCCAWLVARLAGERHLLEFGLEQLGSARHGFERHACYWPGNQPQRNRPRALTRAAVAPSLSPAGDLGGLAREHADPRHAILLVVRKEQEPKKMLRSEKWIIPMSGSTLMLPGWLLCCRLFGWCLGGTGCGVTCVWCPGL